MDIDLVDAVNRQLVLRGIAAFNSGDRDMTHFHASQWDKCHRQIAYHYYHAKGYINLDESSIKNTIDAKLERIFENGHDVHARWNKYFQNTGALLGVWRCIACRKVDGTEEKLGILKPGPCCKHCHYDKGFIYEEVGFFDEETMWGGHVDAVLDVDLYRKYQQSFLLKGDTNKGIEAQNAVDKYLIVDLKSMNPMQFNKLECPLPDHITQMQIYIYLSGLKYGKFIYEDKGSQSTKEFLVVRDDHMLAVKKEEAIWLKFVLTNADDKGIKRLPGRKYKSRSHRDCLRCKFRGDCWKDEG